MKTSKISVLHLVDTLAAGGAEHVAVMLANNLPQDRYRAYFCASRETGPLQSQIQSHVMFYDLHRKGRFDAFAIIRLAEYIRHEHIDVIHAHTTSVFFGAVLTLINQRLKLVWHDHAERKSAGKWRTFVYRPFVRQAQAVFAVTRELARWAVQSLGLPKDRFHYLPNFVEAKRPLKYFFRIAWHSGEALGLRSKYT